MKRLQFRHNDTVWGSRLEALQHFNNIVDKNRTDCIGESLYAEPLVAKYFDEDGNVQVIFAIGVDSGLTPYHIIDSKELAELIETNAQAIEEETIRAIAAEASLSASIETEIARAMEAEAFLSGAVDTERSERIAEDDAIKAEVAKNIATIVPVTDNLGANIREEYVLKNAIGEELGSHIKVYKDSALVGADVKYKGAVGVTQNEDGSFEFLYDGEADKEYEYLYLIYRNEEGGLSLVALDFENFLMESEEGFGIKIVEHKITINIKENEKYLKVDETGLQTINIDEAIKNATDELNAKLDEEINRSKTADEYISGVTREFSASTVAEFISINSALTIETERALAAELHLSGAINTERDERVKKDDEIFTEIGAIKEFNTNLDKKIDVEITRSINEDENFRIQLDHVSSDVNTEKINRENADFAIRQDFAAADIALGSRIDTVITDRDSADQFLSDRIDNEATTRKDADDLLTLTINGVNERVSFIEADYLTSEDKVNMLMAVSGAQNVAIEAKNAAASAQTTADEAKTKIDGFMAAAEIGGAAIDTLIEIQNYIKSDGTVADDMLKSIAENKTAIETEVIRAKEAEKALDEAIKAEVSARTETANILSAALATEITRAIGAETVNATAISNEVKRANDVEEALQIAITTEINNRESADNAIRGDFAAADESLKNRIAAEELARQTAYDALNTRIDNEATTRAESVANLTSLITEGDKAVRESYEAADAVLQQAIQVETQNREAADAVLQTSIDNVNTNLLYAIQSEADARNAEIQAETANREAADADIIRKVETEVSERTQDVKEIREKLVFLENTDATLNTKIDNTREVLLRDITSAYTKADNDILNLSKVYADNIVKQSVDIINNEKVTDIVYNKETKYIQLLLANTNKTVGFDASDFIVDGMLSAVTFDERTNEMTFIWNTPEMSNIVVPLNKFIDQYTVSADSVSFLKISDDNKISAIIDQNDSYANTLASTDYVKMSVETAQQTLSANVESRFEEVINDYNTEIQSLSGKVDSRFEQIVKDHNNDITVLSGNIINYVDKADIALASRVSNNENAIATLNGNKTVVGSVLYNIDNELNTFMLYHGVPITNTTFEDAKRHSLIKKINANGDIGYFASNLTNDMLHVSEEGEVNLNDYITNLHNRIKVLEAQLNNFDRNVENIIKDTIKNYLVGATNEIKVTEINEKLTIGFDDNAIFGEIE